MNNLITKWYDGISVVPPEETARLPSGAVRGNPQSAEEEEALSEPLSVV